jgi:hypothetical protein
LFASHRAVAIVVAYFPLTLTFSPKEERGLKVVKLKLGDQYKIPKRSLGTSFSGRELGYQFIMGRQGGP